jgi:hypothetical protein
VTWTRTPGRSSLKTTHFELVAYRWRGQWRASFWAGGYRIESIPTLPGSTRDEAETACIVAARELAAELVLAAMKASLP